MSYQSHYPPVSLYAIDVGVVRFLVEALCTRLAPTAYAPRYIPFSNVLRGIAAFTLTK